MANSKITDYAALSGAGVNPAADLLEIVDFDVLTNKKILIEELGIALNATQTKQEAGTDTKSLVSPAVQHYHPSAAKAWGLITHATTVTVSYPSAGVSNTNPATGSYVVTHGVTFSSSNYAVAITVVHSGGPVVWRITGRNATTFTVLFENSTDGTDNNIDAFSYICLGDLA